MNFPKIEKNFSYFRIWGKIGPKNDTGNQKILAWSISIFVQICIFCALSSNSNLMRGQAWPLSQIDKKTNFGTIFAISGQPIQYVILCLMYFICLS